jgi:hypothetical protein
MIAPSTTELTPNLTRIQKKTPNGFDLNMYVVKLDDGSTLLYGPLRLPAATLDAVEAMGKPSILLAPNHFHNLGIQQWSERFPNITLVAGQSALPRLATKGHIAKPLSEVRSRVGASVEMIECEGVRNGESWLCVKSSNESTLVVCDAFFNLTGPFKFPTSLIMSLTRTGPGLQFGKTFRWLAINDVARYKAWALAYLRDHASITRVVFSHGEPLEGAHVTQRLSQLLEEAL